MPHRVLRKWLFIDSTNEDFESTMEDDDEEDSDR